MTEATTRYKDPNALKVTVSFSISTVRQAKFRSMARGMGISDSEFIRRSLNAYYTINDGFVTMSPDPKSVYKGTVWNEYASTDEELARMRRYDKWSYSTVGKKVRAYFNLMEKCPDHPELAAPLRKQKRAPKKVEAVEVVIEPVEKPIPVEKPKPVEEPAPYVKPEIPIMPMNAECAKYPDEAVLERWRFEGKVVMRWALKPAVYLSQRWLDGLQPYPEVDTPLARKMLAFMDGIAKQDCPTIEEHASTYIQIQNTGNMTPLEDKLASAIISNMEYYVDAIRVAKDIARYT